MSKSDPASAIFMEDSEAEVRTKIKKAFAAPGEVLQHQEPQQLPLRTHSPLMGMGMRAAPMQTPSLDISESPHALCLKLRPWNAEFSASFGGIAATWSQL